MVKIRLARAGAKKRPFYHVVATESRSSRDGRFIERLGYYNPNARGGEQKLVLDTGRVEHWQSKGAQISERVAYLVKSAPQMSAQNVAAPVEKAAVAKPAEVAAEPTEPVVPTSEVKDQPAVEPQA